MTNPQDELGARLDERWPDSDTAADESNSSSNTGNSNISDDTSNASKPGPEPDTDATRNRRQVPMYLPEEKVELLNGLYERLNGRSKVGGDGGIEKHKDFMEELFGFAIEHEDELADRLDIESE